MLSSLMEVLNSAEDQTVRMVALASKTDNAIPPTKVLPGHTGRVSFVRRSFRRLLPPFIRVSVRIDGMAGNNYVLSGHVLSRLFLMIHQGGPCRRASEWKSIFAKLWSIWLHWNDVVFRGRPSSADAIQHDSRGLTLFWHQGGLDLSGFGCL